MATIDFSKARFAHLNWMFRLRNFLDGNEGLTRDQAVSHKHCDLGVWLYSDGMAKYGSFPELQELLPIHEELHKIIKNIVRLKEELNIEEAEKELEKVKPISNKIITLLDQIEKKVNFD